MKSKVDGRDIREIREPVRQLPTDPIAVGGGSQPVGSTLLVGRSSIGR